jgi:hypothetical protein
MQDDRTLGQDPASEILALEWAVHWLSESFLPKSGHPVNS